MIARYKLDEADYLTNQLYRASVSESISAKRKRTRIVVPVLYAFLAALFLFDDGKNKTTGVFFIIFAVAWYFYYPVWERKRYVNHYRRFVKSNYSNTYDHEYELQLNDDYLLVKDINSNSESRISTSEINVITEIPGLIIIRLKNGGLSLLLPLDKIPGIEPLKEQIKSLCNRLNITYEIKSDWKWK